MIYIRILKNNDFTKLYVIKHCFSRLYRILVLSYLKKTYMSYFHLGPARTQNYEK